MFLNILKPITRGTSQQTLTLTVRIKLKGRLRRQGRTNLKGREGASRPKRRKQQTAIGVAGISAACQ